jgi:hypothetical protein
VEQGWGGGVADIKEVKEDEDKLGRSGGVAAPATKTALHGFISGKCEFRSRTPPYAAREDCLQEWVLLK